jgi:hypothetical protein
MNFPLRQFMFLFSLHGFSFIFLHSILISCSTSKESKSGLLQEKRYYLNFNDSLELPWPVNNIRNIYYTKRAIICEQLMIRRGTNYNEQGTEEIYKSEVLKYTFIDLEKKLCQDYEHFEANAKPVNLYHLPDEGLFNLFYWIKPTIFDVGGITYNLPDTLIDGVSYKRKIRENTLSNVLYKVMYIIGDKTPGQPIYLHPFTDDSIKPQIVLKTITEDTRNPGQLSVLELVNRKGSFLAEKSVFATWKQNLSKSKMLPKSYQEATKEFYIEFAKRDSLRLSN